MKRTVLVMAMCALLGEFSPIMAQEDLAKGFSQPPSVAKPRVYWWWLMSLVSKEGITKDLEQMAAKGIGGVMIFDSAGSSGPMPHGPAFMSSGWRENFKHALCEADRLGLEVSVNLCSGWDAGGPWITPAHASKHFRNLGVVWAEPFSVEITGAMKPAGNNIEIDVINLWPNRLIGDAALSPGQRLTRTNLTMDPNSPLLESGLLGPVTLQIAR